MDSWHRAVVGGCPRLKLLPYRMHVSAKRSGLTLILDLVCLWNFPWVVSVRALMSMLRSHPHCRFLLKRAFIIKRPSADAAIQFL